MLRPHGGHRSSIRRHAPHRAVFSVALLVFFCLAGGCNSRKLAISDQPTGPSILRIGVPQATSQDPLRGLQQASRFLSLEGLVGSNRDGRPRPRLAESWNVSPDGLVWTFRLRNDAKFHDGAPVDAEAVKRSLDKSLANLTDRGLAPGLEDVIGIEAPSPSEVIVRLRSRSTFLLDDLTMAISKQGEGGSPVGTGPFVTTSTSGDQIVMSMFRGYYEGTAHVQQIIWKPYPALRAAWAGMMRGEIDFLYEVGQESEEFVRGESSVSTFAFLRPYVFGVVFNSGRQPLNDERVRRALNFAVNRQLIVDQGLKGHGVPAYGPVWPAHWAYDQSAGGYAYDPGRAAAILDAAHKLSTRSSAQVSSVGPARLRFTCLLPENFSIWERMALLVQKQLFDIGVDMSLEALPADAFNQRIARGDFDAVFLEMVSGSTMSRPYFFWHSAGALNSFGYHNPAVDRALDAIRQAPDDQAYREAVGGLQQSVVADPPAIFLAWGQIARAVSRRFQIPSEPDRDVLLSVSRWQPASVPTEATH